MNVYLKRMWLILVAPAVAGLLAAAFLYAPPVREAVIGQVLGYVEEATGIRVGYERLRVVFPLKVAACGAWVADGGDTLLRVGRLEVDARLIPLLSGKVAVDGVRLEEVVFDTGGLIDGVALAGRVSEFLLKTDSTDFAGEYARLEEIVMRNASVRVTVCDTAAVDSTDAGVKQRIDLRSVRLENVALAYLMPCDSVYININVDKALISDVAADMGAERYEAASLEVEASEAAYAVDHPETPEKPDARHIRLSDVRLTLDSLLYTAGGEMRLRAPGGSAREQSGITVKSLEGSLASDGVRLSVPSFRVTTECSTAEIHADIPLSAFDTAKPAGNMLLTASAAIGKDDILRLVAVGAGSLPDGIAKKYPDRPVAVRMAVGGNAGELMLHRFDAVMTGGYRLHAAGVATGIAGGERRAANVRFKIETDSSSFVAALSETATGGRLRIPEKTRMDGRVSVDGSRYDALVTLREGDGAATLAAVCDSRGMEYDVRLTVDGLEPVHFLPADSIMHLSADLSLKGRGANITRPQTWAEAEGTVRRIAARGTALEDITLSGSLRSRRVQAAVAVNDSFVRGKIEVDGEAGDGSIAGRITATVDTVDFHGLSLTDIPAGASFRLAAEVETDFAARHRTDIAASGCNVSVDGQALHLRNPSLTVIATDTCAEAAFAAGDLRLELAAGEGLQALAGRADSLAAVLDRQLTRDSSVDINEFLLHLPSISAAVSAGRDNPLLDFAQAAGMSFESLRLSVATSPSEGFRADGQILSFVKDTLIVDTIGLAVRQDSLGLQYSVDAVKKRFRSQEAFRANAAGYIRRDEADVFATYADSRGDSGLALGVNMRRLRGGGFGVHLYPEKPVIAFLPFEVNAGNYFRYKDFKTIEADLRLDNESGASLRIYSAARDTVASEVMAELNHIDLSYLANKFATLPALKGVMNATVRYEPAGASFMVVADGNVDGLYCGEGRIGELLLNATYMPVSRGTHQVDLHVVHDMAEVALLSVRYSEGRRENRIDGVMVVDRLPLNIVNALLPADVATLDGRLSGNFAIAGTDERPLIDGSLQATGGVLRFLPSATTLYFDDREVKVERNRLIVDKYRIYTSKNSPLVIDGQIDATDVGRPRADIRLSGTNVPLVDARKTPASMAYGRLSANIGVTLTGPLEALRMNGNMHILGNTDLTCVATESPPEVHDGFNNLVSFTYFADTLPRHMRRTFGLGRLRGGSASGRGGGANVVMNLRIDPAAKVRVNLGDDRSNFVELKGGGELALRYTAQGDLQLNGRYTLSDGAIRYSIPVIPLTSFAIRSGSYVDWTGNPANPFLHITACARVRSTVNVAGEKKMVDFEAGIELRNNLDGVAVKFILEAPTEAVVQNQLISMGEEERGKQAISLLMTGVFLDGGAGGGATGGNNLDVGQALSSLLQREIKNILGNMLGDVPVSFDVETYDGTQQGVARHIDYLGRFYKDFFDERLQTKLGFRYSTKDPVYGNRFFLDDFSVEYFLDADGTHSVKAFRSKAYENLFEGEIAKIGVSYSLSRKARRLRDLFVFRRRNGDLTEEDGASSPVGGGGGDASSPVGSGGGDASSPVGSGGGDGGGASSPVGGGGGEGDVSSPVGSGGNGGVSSPVGSGGGGDASSFCESGGGDEGDGAGQSTFK